MLFPLLLLDSNGKLLANEHNPFLKIVAMNEASSKSFTLVSSRVIDAQLLDNQMLEDLSPALIAPTPVTISRKRFNQAVRNEYENSVCFKRCHNNNDFLISDYSEKQWRLLLEENGHTIFDIIPWKNAQAKEKILQYLVNNACNSGPSAGGIGCWNSIPGESD
ncbi:MAG: hypothetical protein PF482_13290 [Desulfobacteraceae bacterium]|nr:hypothetical protein [Desulfobacteraceae bacterium]